MTQATFKTKEGETILAVVVPKEIEKPQCYDDAYGAVLLYRRNKVVSKIDLELPRNHHPLAKMMAGEQRYNLVPIGLLSQLTEEQAKEIVFYHPVSNGYKVYNENRNSGQSQPWFRTAKYSLQSLIESSGLTFTPEQDVLLIKIN